MIVVNPSNAGLRKGISLAQNSITEYLDYVQLSDEKSIIQREAEVTPTLKLSLLLLFDNPTTVNSFSPPH